MKKMLNKKNLILGAILLIILCLRIFIIFPAKIQGSSMQPTLAHGENVFALRTDDFQKNDIIAFESPMEAGKMLVKRIIGMPGDKIKIEKNKIYVNDKRITEDYLIDYGIDADFTKLGTHSELVVPDNSYFVMGDNRFNSSDSRSFGTISKESVTGKVILRFGFSLY